MEKISSEDLIATEKIGKRGIVKNRIKTVGIFAVT